MDDVINEYYGDDTDLVITEGDVVTNEKTSHLIVLYMTAFLEKKK